MIPVLLLLFLGTALPSELPSPVDVWKNFEPAIVKEHGYIAHQQDNRWYLTVWANEKDDDNCVLRLHSDSGNGTVVDVPCAYHLLLAVTDSRGKAVKEGEKWMAEVTKRLRAAHTNKPRTAPR